MKHQSNLITIDVEIQNAFILINVVMLFLHIGVVPQEMMQFVVDPIVVVKEVDVEKGIANTKIWNYIQGL